MDQGEDYQPLAGGLAPSLGLDADVETLPAASAGRHLKALAAGTVIIFASRLLMFASLPIVTRLFDASAVGAYGLYQTWLNLVAGVATLRLQLAIPMAGNDEEVGELVGVITLVSSAMALLAALGCLACLAAGHPPPPFWWLLPFGVFIASQFDTQQMIASRNGQYRSVYAGQIVQGVAMFAGQIVGGLVFPATFVLVASEPVSRGLALISVSAGRLWQSGSAMSFSALFGKFSFVAGVRRLRQYRSLSLFGTGSYLVQNLTKAIPPAIISSSYGLAILGRFTMGVIYPFAILTVVGTAATTVIHPRVAKDLREGRPRAAYGLVVRVGLSLAAAALMGVGAVELEGRALYGLAFGEAWAPAAQFAQLIAPAYLFVMLSTCLGQTAVLIGRPSLLLAGEVLVMAGVVISTIVVRGFQLGAPAFVVGYSLSLTAGALTIIVGVVTGLRNRLSAAS